MARLNLTIPDALYQRLDRFRDRINLSRVCAHALDKELTMLERQATIENPRLQRLLQRLQRLQGNQERWYQRGRQDGEQWAVEVATQEELRCAGGEGPNRFHRQDADEAVNPGRVPRSFTMWQAVRKWLREELEAEGVVIANMPRAQLGEDFARAFEAGQRIAEEESPSGPGPVRAVFDGFDRSAYLKGWHDAVRDIWKDVSPLLRGPDAP